MWVESKPQDIRNRPGLRSFGTNSIMSQINVPHWAIDLQGFSKSLNATQDIQDAGQQLQEVKRLG